MSQPPLPIIRLCPLHLCEVFRQEGLLAKIEANAWREEIRRRSREGTDTTFKEFTDYNGNRVVETQELSWIDNATNAERARLHRYITSSGKIGGSGLPDPKRIHLESGARYHLTRPLRQEPCEKCGRIGHAWPKPNRKPEPGPSREKETSL